MFSSTNDSGEGASAVGPFFVLRFACRLGAGRSPCCSLPRPSRHFQYAKVRGLTPVSVANSCAVSPLPFHRSTRFDQVSRAAFAIAPSDPRVASYAVRASPSATLFVERIRPADRPTRDRGPTSQRAGEPRPRPRARAEP